jgi:hypothetical protein
MNGEAFIDIAVSPDSTIAKVFQALFFTHHPATASSASALYLLRNSDSLIKEFTYGHDEVGILLGIEIEGARMWPSFVRAGR